MKTYLYRHFNTDSVLLYVGVSQFPAKRLNQHRYVSPWFSDIAKVTSEIFESRSLALEAEQKAIRVEKPLHNIKYHPLNEPKRGQRRVPAWKYLELITVLGDELGVAEIIRVENFNPPPPKTIAGWRLRNSIPSQWVPLLIDVALRRGIIDDIAQLRKE